MAGRQIISRLRRWARARLGRVTQGRRVSAYPAEESVTANFLVCLETGTRHVLLRRHLKETLGLTPAEYRRRWGLPDDYPMIAENYAKSRKAAASRDSLALPER